MRAAIFEKPGLENLKVIDNVDRPKISDHDILIKVKMAPFSLAKITICLVNIKE
jgi:D-arabinose 1-dehydrogenase-like Zn-dependent alcohol dehydrogenase